MNTDYFRRLQLRGAVMTVLSHLFEAAIHRGEKPIDLVYTLSDSEAKQSGIVFPAFTAWGKKYVYFPCCYDGDYWIGSVPIAPCDEATEPIGGG